MGSPLLTGFEPYGDTPINPAEQVAMEKIQPEPVRSLLQK